MNSPLTFGSVFAGIGGFDLGFERAGMSCTWQIENDPKANDILKTWWPDVRRHGDVRYSRAEKFRTGRNWEWFEWLRPVDLLAGGFPCQGISLAGRREGLADARSALFFEFLRIVDELHPRWVVIENVYGLLSSNGGRDMGTILGELEKLGFWWSYRVLDSQYFGVPQRRRRVFIVANSRERTGPFEVLFEPKSCSGHIAPGPAAGKRIAHTLTSRSRSAGGSLPGRGQEDDYNLIYPDQASTLMAKPASRGGDEGKTTAQTLRAGAEHSYQFVFKERGGYGVSSSRDVVPTLESEGGSHQGGPQRIPHVYNPPVAGAVTAKWQKQAGGPAGDEAQNLLSLEHGPRRLTPVEAERLQGFPDGWTEPAVYDTHRYRLVGNAVTVSVANWIARRIVQYEQGEL